MEKYISRTLFETTGKKVDVVVDENGELKLDNSCSFKFYTTVKPTEKDIAKFIGNSHATNIVTRTVTLRCTIEQFVEIAEEFVRPESQRKGDNN